MFASRFLVPPRAIEPAAHLESATEMIDQLLTRGKLTNVTKGQESYMETLVRLVQAYKTQHHAVDVPKLSGLEALKYVMQSSGTSAAEIANLLKVHVTLVYKILKGERSPTVDHIKALAKRFKVRPDLFL